MLQGIAGGGAAGPGGKAGATRASAEEITISGEMNRYNEDSEADQWVSAFRANGEMVGSDHFVGGEAFSVDVPSGEGLSYSFFQGVRDSDTAVYFDENPDIRTFGVYKYYEDTDIGQIDLPKAYTLDIRVVDGDGNPVEDASTKVRHHLYENTWTFTRGTTNADGRFKAPHTKPGIEVEGDITVLAAPPGTTIPFGGGSESNVSSTELTVTADTEIELRLSSGEAENQSPRAAFDIQPQVPTVGEEVIFDASKSSDPDGSIKTYEWDIGGDGKVDTTGQKLTSTFDTAGTHQVILRVRDNQGATDSLEKQVTVSGRTKTRETVTPTPTLTPTPTPSGPPQETLRRGEQSEIRVRRGEDVATYYVIHSIPGWEDHRRAVTSTDYELVGLGPTRDALWVEHYVSFQLTDIVLDSLKQRRDTVKQRRQTYNIRRDGQRFAEFLVNVAQIIALVKSSGYKDALDELVDTFTDLITWTQADDAYEKAFTSMAHAATNINWAKDRAEVTRKFDAEADHLLETAGQFHSEYLDILAGAHGQYGNFTDVYKAFDDFWGRYDASMGLFHGDVDASKVNKYGNRVSVSVALQGLDMFVEDYFSAEARHAAVMASLYTVELPILAKLIDLLEDIKNQIGSPGKLLRYHLYQYTLYQLTAQGNDYASGILENQGGPMVWLNRATPNVDSLSKRAETHRRWAASNRNYAASEFAKIGGTQTDVDRRVNHSLNASSGDQEVTNG